MLLVGVDVGGTFTDIVIFNTEAKSETEFLKIPTNTKNSVNSLLEALTSRNRSESISLVSHATTIATNALLTHSELAKVALITNEGFRDILEIGRQRRPEIYNLRTKRPPPLIERASRFVVKERTLSDGSNIEQVDENGLKDIAKKVVKGRYESVAISFLNSHSNPEQERKSREILRQSGFKGPIDISSEIDPQYREYERTSSTVVNASLTPLMSRYIAKFKDALDRNRIQCPVYIMNSDGTVSPSAQASKRPISIIESGPAAGVLSSQKLANHLSLDRVITFDMGGTTAKAGAIANAQLDLAYEFEAASRAYHGRSIRGSGYPVRQPFIDLAEVSAGGGTIARIDDTGSLKVGPESAGANPGPAAYGKGGKQATVTDANIVTGRLSPSRLLGGRLKLHYALAAKAISRLSGRLGTTIGKTATNILRITNSSMNKALSLVSIERGRDPRDYTLIAFGGSGPLHACDLAEELGIKRIVIPTHPGLFSAFGLLTAELTRSFSQPILKPISNNIERPFIELRKEAQRTLKQEGIASYRMLEQIDLRYSGQAYDITIPYRKHSDLARRFGREHKRLYGYYSDDPVEAVNGRIRAIVPTPKPILVEKKVRPSKPLTAASSRKIFLHNAWRRLPVYDRDVLAPGMHDTGPCIIEEYDSTSLIGESWNWKVDSYANLDLSN